MVVDLKILDLELEQVGWMEHDVLGLVEELEKELDDEV